MVPKRITANLSAAVWTASKGIGGFRKSLFGSSSKKSSMKDGGSSANSSSNAIVTVDTDAVTMSNTDANRRLSYLPSEQ